MLSADGRVSESFHWTDENDQRDPCQVLEAEGVVFSEDGYASEEQRLCTEELGVLVEQADEALDEDAGLTAAPS